MVKQVYAVFGYNNFSIRIALRPEQRLGSDEQWDRAEFALIEAVQALGYAYELAPGEGSFYSPKIEISMQDHLGRLWQCGTIQVDLNFPQLFDLSFINQKGDLEQVVDIAPSNFRFFRTLDWHFVGKSQWSFTTVGCSCANSCGFSF